MALRCYRFARLFLLRYHTYPPSAAAAGKPTAAIGPGAEWITGGRPFPPFSPLCGNHDPKAKLGEASNSESAVAQVKVLMSIMSSRGCTLLTFNRM